MHLTASAAVEDGGPAWHGNTESSSAFQTISKNYKVSGKEAGSTMGSIRWPARRCPVPPEMLLVHLEQTLGLKKGLSPVMYLLPGADVSHGT